MKNFILIGAAGYIAPRHMRAIKNTGNNLLAAYDPFDSVGILDSYFPDADFFTEFEILDRHLEKLKRKGVNIDYVSICSPNYLHDAHIRYGLKLGANVICEKPLVLNPWNVEALSEIEKDYPGSIYTILQLRLHEKVIELRNRINSTDIIDKINVSLEYFTSRGKWYHYSWKGDENKSGGITTNIGIHFYDMLMWIFGDVISYKVHALNSKYAEGVLELEKAIVNWKLSIDYDLLPEEIKKQGQRTYRSLKIADDEFEFSKGFTDLHDLSYEKIIKGEGFRVIETQKTINLVHQIRNASIVNPQ